jgi:hypothetical protein
MSNYANIDVFGPRRTSALNGRRAVMTPTMPA